MEINEIISFAEKIVTDDNIFCDESENDSKNPGWKVTIHGIRGESDAKILAKNIPKVVNETIDLPLPKKALGWDVDICTPYQFPWQAHHLIPGKLLPEHEVCFFLAKNSKWDHEDFILEFDTNYDTNDGWNGRFLPFASTTHQWNKAGNSATKKRNVCNKMMKNTLRQLHQGPHSKTDYLQDEDPNAESSGYKQAVRDLLDAVYEATENHVNDCKYCQGKKKANKTKIRPLESTVEHMHQVSTIMESLIINDKVFVSRRAATFYAKIGYF